MLCVGVAFVALPSTVLHLGCMPSENRTPPKTEPTPDSQPAANGEKPETTAEEKNGNSMQIHYLEIVTTDADSVCKTYSQVHDITFGEPDQSLGGARTAKLSNGGILGVRSPMRESELPVVRPYVLVTDIQAAVDAASEAGAEVALPPMEIPGHGTCAIVIQGGIESGLWQL